MRMTDTDARRDAVHSVSFKSERDMYLLMLSAVMGKPKVKKPRERPMCKGRMMI